MADLIVSSFVLGLIFAAPPGMVLAQAIRSGLARGFKAALMVELGSLIGDAVWSMIALLGIAFLVQNPITRTVLGAVGVLLVLYLAWDALKAAWAGGSPTAREAAASGDFMTGAALSLSNPWNIVFWLGIGSTAFAGIAQPTSTQYLVFWLAFMLACTVYAFVISYIIASTQRIMTPTFFRVINLVCGLALLYFAYHLARDVVNSLFT